MNKNKLIAIACWLLTACAPIQNAVNNQYKLESFSANKTTKQKTALTILVSQPDAIAGYQTDQMLYINKPFELSTFAHNAWVSSPANMLYPLIIQSLQQSNYFYAVVSGPDADKTDYRIDTQLFALQQNFLSKPSSIELVANVVLTHVRDNRVVSSRLISEHIPCPEETPYGGVIAANKAARAFTAKLSDFIIKQVNKDHAF